MNYEEMASVCRGDGISFFVNLLAKSKALSVGVEEARSSLRKW